MSIKYINIYGPPKFTQIGIVGLKRNHLATLIEKPFIGFGFAKKMFRTVFSMIHQFPLKTWYKAG
jgi:hypothetical protein